MVVLLFFSKILCLFLCSVLIAGFNIFTIANPYDGGSIGGFGHDTMRNIANKMSIGGAGGAGFFGGDDGKALYGTNMVAGGYYFAREGPTAGNVATAIGIDISRVVPSGGETAPGWSAYVIGVTY
jgi:hypothetical protein